MTLPTLINNINNKHNIALLKNVYSLMSQASLNIVRENNDLSNLCDGNDNDCIRDLFKNHVKTIKTCNQGSIEGNCWVHQNEWKRMNGVASWSMENKSGFILNDGIFVLLGYDAPNCDYQAGSADLPADILHCGDISVDVNGFKGPNVIGKDIFFFYMLQNRLVPFGTEGTWTGSNRYYRCEYGGDGEACTAEYISDVKVKFKN